MFVCFKLITAQEGRIAFSLFFCFSNTLGLEGGERERERGKDERNRIRRSGIIFLENNVEKNFGVLCN